MELTPLLRFVTSLISAISSDNTMPIHHQNIPLAQQTYFSPESISKVERYAFFLKERIFSKDLAIVERLLNEKPEYIDWQDEYSEKNLLHNLDLESSESTLQSLPVAEELIKRGANPDHKGYCDELYTESNKKSPLMIVEEKISSYNNRALNQSTITAAHYGELIKLKQLFTQPAVYFSDKTFKQNIATALIARELGSSGRKTSAYKKRIPLL